MQDARTAAWRVLLRLEQGAPAQEVLDSILRSTHLDARDKALCSELVYGCLRAELRVSFVLGKLLQHPDKLPRSCWLILEIAVYAMLFLEKMPDHAVVNWAVSITRSQWGGALAGVVNGVLRSLGRMADAARQEDFYAAQAKTSGKKAGIRARRMTLARWYSMPLWIVDMWHAAYGEDTAIALLERSARRPWSCLRLNPQHPAAARLRTALNNMQAFPVADDGFAFTPGKTPTLLAEKIMEAWHREGALSWQAAGSQYVLAELGCQQWRVPVWDACCGQGGKTTWLLERGVPVQLVSDISQKRLARVVLECHRLGLPKPLLCLADMTCPPLLRWEGNIVLDVPCTGLGTLARRPDIRRHCTYTMLQAMCALQQGILEAAWNMLTPGAELAYITCALDPQENEGQIEAFLARHKNATLLCTWQTAHTHIWMEGMYGARLSKQ